MTVPWQAKDSSVPGVLQEQRGNPPHSPGWDQAWGTPAADGGPGFFRVEWLEGQGLQEFLQQWVAALLNLDGSMIRPRWQAEPVPNLPSFSDTWVAVGIHAQRPIGTYAWVAHGDGFDEMHRHEELEVLVSIYGPDADELAGRLHSNLVGTWQNTNLLRKVRMAFVDVGEFIWAPDFIKQQWMIRVDKMITLRRMIIRDYPVLNLERFHGLIYAEGRYKAPFGWPKRPPPPPEALPDAPRDDQLYVRGARQWYEGLAVAGGRMQGPMRLQRDASEPLEAITKRQADDVDGGRY